MPLSASPPPATPPAVVFRTQDGKVVGRTSRGNEPRSRGEVISLMSDRQFGGRRRFRVSDIERFFRDSPAAPGPDGSYAYIAESVFVTVIALDDDD